MNDGIISIGQHDFYDYENLESIYVGNAVCKIEDDVFACSGINEFYFFIL